MNVIHDLNTRKTMKNAFRITKDKYIVIGQQGEYSKANPGRYAPSGSGSVNFSDLKLSKDFNSLIINAMEREFCEEIYLWI